jgi:hypothetical protein
MASEKVAVMVVVAETPVALLLGLMLFTLGALVSMVKLC